MDEEEAASVNVHASSKVLRLGTKICQIPEACAMHVVEKVKGWKLIGPLTGTHRGFTKLSLSLLVFLGKRYRSRS